jgi:phosphoribosylformimino-5-aminoimidazole carboxamide ribotide isomerase
VVIYSLTYYNEKISLFESQIVYALISLIVMIVFTFLDYRSLKALSWWLYFIGIILLGLVLFFGKSVFGAVRWLDLGIFQLQPAELVKLFVIFALARYFSGKMGEAKIYSSDILGQARKWCDAGAKRIHLVDLNGAFEGKPVHFKEVTQIAKNLPQLQMEIGGGIRALTTIQAYFDAGVHFCILGTSAIKNPSLVEEACRLHPHKIILGLDAKNGFVATQGWDTVSSKKATESAQAFKNSKLESIIFTDIAKDGMMQGMNFDALKEMTAQSPFPIIASGGFTQLADVKRLKKIPGIMGVIAGKALYEGLVDLKKALTVASC